MLRQVPKHRLYPGRSAIAITAAVLVSAAVLPAAAASAAPRSLSFGASGTAAPRSLLLINGDLLSIRSIGGVSTGTLTAGPDRDPLWTLRTGSGTYEFPVDAIPYLGHGLDASLFNVTLLRRLESGGRLPVRLSYAGAVPSVPGITITKSGGGLASGYLTAASAAVFGRALARQFAAGHARGNYGGAGPLSGVNIALAGARVPVPIEPQFPQHQLTVTATNEFGKADNADEMLVLNADNLETYGDPNEAFNVFYHGSAKYSVPAGHYWALADFFLAYKKVSAQRLVVLPQFTVAGSNTTVHVAASSASSEVTFSTPRRAQNALVNWTIVRSGAHGPAAISGTTSFFSPTWISPTKAKPSIGSISSSTAAQLFSPPKLKGTPYNYNLDFPGPPGIVPSQHFAVTSANVATVNERVYDSARSMAFPSTVGGNLAQLSQEFLIGLGTAIKAPGEQTEYMSGGPSFAWDTDVFTDNNAFQEDTFHTLANGRTFTENWNQYPLHPQPFRQLLTGKLGAFFVQIPSAFRVGNELWFVPNVFSDNDSQFGHLGGAESSGTYEITDNGKRIASGGFNEFARAKLTSAASTVSFSLNEVQQPNPLTLLSQGTDTVWTMRTASAPKAVVPKTWECVTKNFNPTQHCRVPSMLTLNYQVNNLGLNGVVPAGPQQVSVSVGHVELAAPSAIVSAKARVSWDDGLFWSPASVTKTGAGTYRVNFTPPPGVDVTLNFSASDAAGGSINETITDAYAVGPMG